MATYTAVSRSVPSNQRVVQITAVAAGDQIDLTDALGRPARRVQFYMTATADVIEYTLNSLRKIVANKTVGEAFTSVDETYGVFGKSEIEVWSGGSGYTSFSSTGSTVLETGEDLVVSSIQIDSLSLSSGSTITIVAW